MNARVWQRGFAVARKGAERLPIDANENFLRCIDTLVAELAAVGWAVAQALRTTPGAADR